MMAQMMRDGDYTFDEHFHDERHIYAISDDDATDI